MNTRMGTTGEELQISPEQIAGALLEGIYSPVTALVSLDVRGALLEVRLFDTQYAPLPALAEGCASALVLFGHPDGWRALHPVEERLLSQLRGRLGGKAVRVFLAGEELGCLELREEGTKAAV